MSEPRHANLRPDLPELDMAERLAPALLADNPKFTIPLMVGTVWMLAAVFG